MPDASTNPNQPDSASAIADQATPQTGLIAANQEPAQSKGKASGPTAEVWTEKIGDVHLVTKTGADAACHPKTDGLAAEAYSHIEVMLHLGDGNPVKPETIGIPLFAPYFDAAGKAWCMAKEVLADLRAALAVRAAQNPKPSAAA